MSQVLERDYLKNLLGKRKQHVRGKVQEILPFSSSKRNLRGIFDSVLGEFVRNICNLKLDEAANILQDQKLSDLIVSRIEFDDSQAKSDFIRFLKQYLFNGSNINPIHPYLYNYIGIEQSKKGKFTNFAKFINGVLVCNNKAIENIFSNKEADDILTEIILTELDALKIRRKTNKSQYDSLLPTLTKLYQEDLLYLSKHKDYFLTAFPLLTHYYVFMYVCQLIFKFDQYTSADYEKIEPLYFALDWESIRKRRSVASDPFASFKSIREKSENLFPHIHTIYQINHNSIHKNEETNRFIPYSKLYLLIKKKGKEYEYKFFTELKEWIKDYSNMSWINIDTVKEPNSLPQAFEVLHSCIKKGMSTEVVNRYAKHVVDLGAGQFLKARGSLGHLLNMKKDFLLLLTAVSVKEKRIPLNKLFYQFENRGIIFDAQSKKEVIALLDNLNILDKKSDSGDAQYVKPIL